MRLPSIVALCLAAGSTLAAPPSYRVDLIERAPGSEALHGSVALNNLGWAIGNYPTTASGAFGYRVFIWKPGAPAVDIGHPEDLSVLLAADINDAGMAVGVAAIDFISTETNSHVWSWQDGVFTTYDQFVPGRPAQVGWTNEAGRVIGWANDDSFTGQQAVEYLPDGLITVLPPATPGSDTAVDINNNDVILGTELRGTFLHFPGDPDRTILPPPSATLPRFHVQTMNDLEDVVGSARVATHAEGSTAAVWLDDAGWRLLPRPGRFNTATAINNARQVIGNSRDNTGARGDHGWYWTQEDGLIPLEELIEPAGVWGVLLAHDINERGQIATIVMDRVTGDTFGAVLTPLDEGCYADCDVSGELDFFDFLCFQNLFAAGDAAADCDASGGLDFFDFLCFQNDFAAGCP